MLGRASHINQTTGAVAFAHLLTLSTRELKRIVAKNFSVMRMAVLELNSKRALRLCPGGAVDSRACRQIGLQREAALVHFGNQIVQSYCGCLFVGC